MAPSGASSLDDVVEGLAQRRIETGRRLVEQQHSRLAEQRLREPEPLAHALRIGADAAVGWRPQADACRAVRGP